MARLEFRLPDIGEGVAEAEIVEWHAGPGDAVREGQVLVAVMTDKASVEMEAPADGTLLERCGETGTMLPVGAVLFVLETDEEPAGAQPGAGQAGAPLPPREADGPTQEGPFTPPAAVPAGAAARPERRVLAAPAVRQRARTLGIDLAAVAASGEQVRHEDLDRHILSGRAPPAPPRPPAPPARTPGPDDSEWPVSGLRRQIARRMEEAKRHIAHFTYADEIDVTALETLRAALNRDRGERPSLHLLPFMVAALCRALRDFPMLNAHYDDERDVVTRFGAVDLGIATQTEAGLMVPVLRDAGALDLWQIAAGIRRLADGARAGGLGREDLRGSTITVTSLGRLGGIAATPIVNRPEVAILAPHRVIERAVPVAGGFAARKIMNLSISCDHRVIDGFVAAAFVQSLRQRLEAPEDLAPAAG